jgi:hypothetical protein
MRFEGRDRYPVATTLQDFLVRSEEVSRSRHFNRLAVPTLNSEPPKLNGYFQRRAHRQVEFVALAGGVSS